MQLFLELLSLAIIQKYFCILFIYIIYILVFIYCYENGNGVLKIIKKGSKNKTNLLVYMINDCTKI